jgi:hypothetical protein
MRYAWFAILVSLASLCAAQQKPMPQVMIVGTYHFDNPGRDIFNIHSEGILSPEKQKEIDAVIVVLKQFRPTKVVIEAPVASAKTPQRYADYLSGRYTLTANEIDQLGFRLAKEMGHTRIYPVDVEFPFDFEEVAKFAAEHKQKQYVDGAFEVAKGEVGKIQEHVDHGTVLETLRFLNDPAEVAKGHSFYMMLAQVGEGDQYPGAKLLGEWYQRNVEIHGNIRKIIDSPEDRVVVIYGSGHVFWLERDVIDAGDFKLQQFDDLK